MPHELANDYDDNTEKQNTEVRDILILEGIVGNFAQGIQGVWITYGLLNWPLSLMLSERAQTLF